MIDPISTQRLTPIAPSPVPSSPAAPAGGGDFTSQLKESLEQVSRMQAEAEDGIHQVLTGQSDDITGVFTAARKAEIAFSLLMEIRNKLVDAYVELRQMRV